MLSLGLLFYLLVLGASADLTIDDYDIDIQTDSLPRFLPMKRLSDDWNILEIDKRRIDESVFDSAASIRILNPTDNFFVVLPQSVLSNLKNLDLPSQTGNGTAENSTSTDADVYNLEFPEVADNPVESLTVGKFNRSGESIDSSIECLEKMYRKLLDYQFRRVNLRRIENEELR